MSKMLSPHFSLAEATESQTAARLGIDNTPREIDMYALRNTASRLEQVRGILGTPLLISSWYRCPELNKAIGSKPTSQHVKGEAVDFISPQFGDPVAICKKLKDFLVPLHIDQLILEHTWVHISFAISSGKPRNQVLSLLANKSYAVGLTNKYGVPYES